MLFGKEQLTQLNLSAKDLEEILSFASLQGVLGIIMPLFENNKTEDELSQKVIIKWYSHSVKIGQSYLNRLKTMRELSKLFAEEGLDVMYMKGATLAQLYPNPKWRRFSDIDYYLFGKSEQGIKAMTSNGIKNSAYYHHHTQASLNGVLLENHYDFVERINHRCDVILDDALKDLAAKEGKSIPATFLGDDVKNAYVMTPTMNAIFLMRHMSAHFVGETIPLRMLYDWALFLEKQGKEVDWSLVMHLYDQSGKTAFAEIIQRVIRTHLEYESKECPIKLSGKEDAERVWNSIIFPPKQDPYKKFSLKYYLFETKTFFANRWKHKLVYPGESYALLFFKYVWSAIKKKCGLLKMN